MAKPLPQQSGLDDAPIKNHDEDTLEMRAYAEALAEFTLNCKTPMTVSIQGDWGSGKSSIMHMVESAIPHLGEKGRAAPKTIWFDTWQFAQFGAGDALPITLLSTFIRHLEGNSKAKDGSLKEAMGIVRRLMIAPVGNAVVKAATVGALSGEDIFGSQEDGKLRSELLDELRKKLRTLLEQEGRVIFFVDDLDRIPPIQAVTLLETIKIFLNVENVVFILALDYEVVERGLKDKFNISSDDLGGRSFFDKLIQLPFSIPVGSYKVERYLRTALEDLGYLVKAKKGQVEDVKKIVSLVERSVGRNPRAIKQVLNSLHLLRLIRGRVGDDGGKDTETGLDALELDLAVLCLQSQFEPVYSWLSRSGGGLKSKLDRMDRDETDDETEGGSPVPAGEVDDYMSVLTRMLDKAKGRQRQEQEKYEQFKKTFLSLIGVGRAPSPDQELERRIAYLDRALNLTRVTSSGTAEVIDQEVQGLKFNPIVRRAIKTQTRNPDPNSFWGHMTSLHAEISAAGGTEIRVRQPATVNGVQLSFQLKKIPCYLTVLIADDRAEVGLEFDGRNLRNEETRKSYLEMIKNNPELPHVNLSELTSGDINVFQLSFEDTSLEAVQAREPVLIEQLVGFLTRLDAGFD